MKWDNVKFMGNVLDMKQGERTIIIGTLFKEQKLKPNVFTNITAPINAVSAIDCSRGAKIGQFTSDDDYAILEDLSGRIQIRESAHFKCNQFQTGSIVALLGTVDAQGYFICEDFCYAGIPFSAELPAHIKLGQKEGLFDNLSSRRFIAFASGLNFGLE